MIGKAIAFLKKDLLIESSYKFAFISNLLAVFISILGYFFIDKLFGQRIAPNLQEFGISYFPYVLLSNAFFGYVGVGLGAFSERIRAEQIDGTLEMILITPTRISTMLFSMILWNLMIATIDIVIYITAGILLGADFSNINLFSALIVLVLTVASFSALGILSAAFILVFKQGNPVGWLISGVEGLIGGVYFPITVLPWYLQAISYCFPITYAIRAIELSVYKGYGVMRLAPEIGMLVAFSAILMPLSFFAFSRALHKARREGTLSQY